MAQKKSTAKRMAEIEALKQARDGADRLAIQAKLMPYDEHLMPETLQGRNERLGETIADRGEYWSGGNALGISTTPSKEEERSICHG